MGKSLKEVLLRSHNLAQKLTPPKNENSVIIYSHSSCCKPVWVSFFCWTQRKIFWLGLGSIQILQYFCKLQYTVFPCVLP